MSPRRLERLLEIDHLLRTHFFQTSVSLSQALEVSERTIRTDLNFLRDRLNAPLEYSKKRGWYYTKDDWRLPSITLSQGEIFALTLGARMLEAYSGSVYKQELRTSIQLLSERLPDKTSIDLQQLADEHILFHSGAQMLNLNPQIWMQLQEACRTSKKVWIRYYAPSNQEESERVVDPYLTHVYRGTNPYLISFCHKRKEMRWFRIDRIRELRLLPETFIKDPNFDAQTYLAEVFQAQVGGKSVGIAIGFDTPTAPYIRERQWHPSQILDEHPDGSLTLYFTASGLDEVKRWVMGYGKGAVVKSPPELVTMVRTELQSTIQNYQFVSP